jgi:hypothetical protein
MADWAQLLTGGFSMVLSKISAFLLFFNILISVAHAAPASMVRWTGLDDRNAEFAHVLTVLNQKLNAKFQATDFIIQDDRDLAFNHYTRYEQVVNGDPIEGKSIRVWKALKSDVTVQVEAVVEIANASLLEKVVLRMSDAAATKLATKTAKANLNDPYVRGITYQDMWTSAGKNAELIRVFKIKGKRGKSTIKISHRTRKVVSNVYVEFPQDDTMSDEQSVPALVYPIYEEYNDVLLPRVPVLLKHVLTQVQKVPADLYAPLKTSTYAYDKFSATLGESAEGRAQGFWAMSYVKREAAKLRAALPLVANSYANGLVLQGKYATINIHPDAFEKFPGADFNPKPSAPFFPNWNDTTETMIPSQAYFGKPINSAAEAFARPATRLMNHDPALYMNQGFDEIQVYYAINTLMESLQASGFTDPDLSTRPFNAFLFNPDIAYRDNAFYTDDTINFTTYSPKQMNYARDNSTIWHELGHGVMDRLMGDNIALADTGGLSEGMADFVAQLVVQDVTSGIPFPGSDTFRIMNHTGFNLTNEVHDDGEAYGGVMKDFMDAVIAKNPKNGLKQVTDVILETMRLTRDYPGLSAADWFNHILFADQLGRPGVRLPGELSSSLLAVLNGRNFHLDGTSVAEFKLVNEGAKQEVLANTPGSRQTPNQLTIAKDAEASFDVSATLKSSGDYHFQYPVTVKIQFTGGPIQGAAHWVGEEQGTQSMVMNSEAEMARFTLKVKGACDEINREDGSCVDFAYIQIFNHGVTDLPVAKKRFYVQIRNPKP